MSREASFALSEVLGGLSYALDITEGEPPGHAVRTLATGIAASHHERLDGSGYHRGLAAFDLPRPARILAVADEPEFVATLGTTLGGHEGLRPVVRRPA